MRSRLNDDDRFPTLAEQDRLDAAAMDEPPTITDSLVWDGMYDGADAESDWLDGMADYFDPDDEYGTERY